MQKEKGKWLFVIMGCMAILGCILIVVGIFAGRNLGSGQKEQAAPEVSAEEAEPEEAEMEEAESEEAEMKEAEPEEAETEEAESKEAETEDAESKEDVDQGNISEKKAEAMDVYREYLTTLGEEYVSFSLLDLNQDGIWELFIREEAPGSARDLAEISLLTCQEEQIRELWSEGFTDMGLTLANENYLIVTQDRGAGFEYIYYVTMQNEQLLTEEIYVEYGSSEEGIQSVYYVNDQLCDTEEELEHIRYMGFDDLDPDDAGEQWSRERMVQTTRPLKLYPNTENSREFMFGNTVQIPDAEWGMLEYLCGVIHYMNNYGSYVKPDTSVMEWSDEAKLEFFAYFINKNFTHERISCTELWTDCALTQRAGIVVDGVNYCAVSLNEVNRVLAGIFGTGLESTPDIPLAKYQDGFYLIYCSGDWGEYDPCSIIDTESIVLQEDGTIQFKVEGGQGIIEYREGGPEVIDFDVRDSDRQDYSVKARRDKNGFLADMILEEWDVAQ